MTYRESKWVRKSDGVEIVIESDMDAWTVAHPTSQNDCPTCPPEPVSYPGGTQWAIKRNYRRLPTQYPIPVNKGLIVASVQYLTGFRSESEARDYLDKVLTPAAELDVPDSPELWPELVCADIEWKVAK